MKWTAEEVSLLKQLINDHTYEEIAQEFTQRVKQGYKNFGVRRSAEAIRKKVRRARKNGINYKVAKLEERIKNLQSAQPSRHLVVGDAHVKIDQDLSRFELLGKMCADLEPDVIIFIGDLADMESLCSYDRGKKSSENRRYMADIKATNRAIELFQNTLDYHAADGYEPRIVYTEGNHEDRIRRAVEDEAILESVVSLDDFDFKRWGWEVYRFKTVAKIDGVAYSHYFPSGVMGRAIGGVNAGRSMTQKLHVTAVAGHSHLFHVYRDTDPHGRAIWGLQVGCFFEHDEDYAGPSNRKFWRGIFVLENVQDGDFDINTWSMNRIRRTYAS